MDAPPWLFASLRRYRRDALRRDLFAGLSVWAVLIPEALAYATIAGVSPVIGLYAAVPALVLYAALGSSRLLIAGPMSATAALSAATVADQMAAGDGAERFLALTVVLAVTCGAIALTAGLLRLGFLASFISEPVIKGFILALALTIIVGQLPTLFGVASAPGDVFAELYAFLGALDDVEAATLAVGVASLSAMLALRRAGPLLPGALICVVASTLLVGLLGLDENGVAVVGPVTGGLPDPALPDARWDDYADLVGGALGIILVAFAEGLGAARTVGRGSAAEIDPDRELIALGAANLGSGLWGGFVVNGSLSKTAVNAGAGARTQLSSLVVAALTILTLVGLTGLFADLPQATLAAVVIVAVLDLVDLRALAAYWRAAAGRSVTPFSLAARPDFVAALAVITGVLVLGTVPGLFAGVGVSLVLLLYRVSRPHVAELGRAPGGEQYTDRHRHPENIAPDGVAVLRVESPMFFANAGVVRSRIRAAAARDGIFAVVLDAETVPTIDITAAHMLQELSEDLEREGVRLLLARDVGRVRDVLRRSVGERDPALTRVFPTVADAVRAAQRHPPRR